MPFAGYEDFDDCVRQNRNLKDAPAFCGWLERRTKASAVESDDMRLRLVDVGEELPNPDIVQGDDGYGDPEEIGTERDDFHTLLVVEGVWTGDGRYMEPGSLSWRNLPLPLMGLDRTTEGHANAVLIGNIHRIERTGNELHGWGTFVASEDGDVRRLQQLIENGELRGVSVDLDSVTYDVMIPAGQTEAAEDADGTVRVPGDDSRMIVTAGRIMGATVVPFPAFAEAYIESTALLAAALQATQGPLTGYLERYVSLDDIDFSPPKGAREEAQRGLDWRREHGRGGTMVGVARARDIAGGKSLTPDTVRRMLSYFARHEVDKQGTGWSPGEDGFPSAGRIAWALWGGDPGHAWARKVQEQIDVRRRDGAITAAAGIVAPVCPPRDWYADPALPGPTPITVTDSGRVFGHVATWGTCHIGLTGRCVTPPRSASGYAIFLTGEVLCEDGSRVPVGQLTMDTGHAALDLSARPAAAHYDHTGTAVADVTVGEDEHGIWCAGSLRPDLTPERVRAFMASDVSGDWRTVAGNMELVAVLSVNVPGFPKRRIMAHESRGMVASLISSEHMTRPELSDEVERIAASIGRSRADRVEALRARVKGGR